MAETTTVTTYDAVLGQVLVTLRVAKGLKQGDLAAAVGIGPSTWSRIERGESGLSIGQLNLAAKALCVKAHQILDAAEVGVKEAEDKGVRVEPWGTTIKELLQAEEKRKKAKRARSVLIQIRGTAADRAIFVGGAVIPVVGPILGGVIGAALGAYFAKEQSENDRQK